VSVATDALTHALPSETSPSPRAPLHIPSLDGIRALSFALVFIGHAGLNHIVPTAFGVTVFFFLSGYLITTLLRLERAHTGAISLRSFYLRRALRILPPFYLVFALAFVAHRLGLTPAPAGPGAITTVLLHVSNYYIVAEGHHGLLAGTGVYWSLAVEEHFYLLFPALYWLLLRTASPNHIQAALLLAVCAAILAWRCLLVLALDAAPHRTQVASDTRFDSLLFGCALALHENPALDRSRLPERIWKRWLFPLALAGLALSFAVRAEAFRETVRYSLQGLCLVPVFVCAVRYPRWLPMRPLNLRPVAFIGVLSYSLYLVHLLAIDLVGTHVVRSGVARAVVSLAVSVAISWGIYRVVEKPCARLRRRLSV
jgi:peptidoglycan/LPS O-acetylase OafA/YrhL